MKIQINKFFLKHDGILYKTGSIIDIADENLAKRLVGNSDGAFSVYHDDNVNTATATEPAAADPNGAAAGVSVPAKDTNTDANVLPEADPSQAVASKKK